MEGLDQLENGANRGKLTIFLGATPGVGKTYAMLESAHDKRAQGVDVVVGWIGAYKGTETKHLLRGLPLVAARKNDYQGRVVLEMDIDAILERCPQLAIVDNLAHINLPGSRHTHRYQDVAELLQSGIDVFTTLNIHHVESLKDIVEQITGIQVKETVPDRLLEEADQIKLIDVSPEELSQRIKEGKVYLPDDVEQSLEKFFRPGNINALRELALRYTAQRVDRQLNRYMQVHDIKGPWPAGERILACISPSPFSAQVIRTARRMAAGLQAEWVVAYVDTHKRSPSNEKGYDQLEKNLRLAEELGAEVITLSGEDVAEELLNLARRKNITQIVIGKPLHSRIWNLWQGSIVDKVVRQSQGISVHIIPGKQISRKNLQVTRSGDIRPSNLLPYLFAAILVVIVTLLNKMWVIDLINISLLYLLPVLFSAAYWGRGPL